MTDARWAMCWPLAVALAACGTQVPDEPAPPPTAPRVIDLRGVERHLAAAELSCADGARERAAIGPEMIARFDAAPMGPCTLRAQGGGSPMHSDPLPEGEYVVCVADGVSRRLLCVEAEAPKPATAHARLVVHLIGDPPALNGAEVICPSGYAVERALSATLEWPDAPVESCELWFRGKGPPINAGRVEGGESWMCTFARRQPDCVRAPSP